MVTVRRRSPSGHGPACPPARLDEAYYVLDGEVDFEIDGEPVKTRAGDFNYLPRNTVHGFKGASQSPARVLIFAAPAHGTEFFMEINRDVRDLPADLGKIPDIGKRHGIEFMPPAAEA